MPKILTQSDKNPIGMIVASMLTEPQFQALNGTSWVIADGRSATGSAYATITSSTTIPDLRGRALRGKNNPGTAQGDIGTVLGNADGDLALNTFQYDQYASHTHSFSTFNIGWGAGGTDFSRGRADTNSPANLWSNIGLNAAGGNETRMKNITVNYFIKINN